MSYATTAGLVGQQQCAPYGLPDTVSRALPGLIYDAVDPYWGGGEFMYCKAGGSIRQYGLVSILQTFASNQVVFTATEVANVGNTGRPLGVAMVSATVGQFLWVMVTGTVPVNCNASVAADTTFGIAAAGQGGANAAGKQVLNAHIAVAGAATVAKTGCLANSGSKQLFVPNTFGWFAGVPLSGTGIAASSHVVDIDPSGNVVTLDNATTAAVNGTVTATYNDGTIFYNVAHVNRPFSQGAIT